MTKDTYRELEALAVQAIKTGLLNPAKDGAALASGLQALATLHAIRHPAGNAPVGTDEFE